MTRERATCVGASALLLWAALATLTLRTAPVPPFLLTATTFTIGAILGLGWTAWRRRLGLLFEVPLAAYVISTLGLFSNHAFFFAAFRWGPAAEVMLVNYTWPLLIVLLSASLPGERLMVRHLIGVALSFGGLVVLQGDRPQGMGVEPGILLALGSALTWSLYSVASRWFKEVPTEAVAVSCLATALLSLAAHLLLEETVWPSAGMGWAALVLIGLGPAGIAFLTWDLGMKKGHIQFLGVAAYAAPLLSTALLIMAGEVTATPALGMAALMVAAGSAVASGTNLRALFRQQTRLGERSP